MTQPSYSLPRVYYEILGERGGQDKRWGEQNHSDLYWLGILAEEFGEVAKDIIEGKNHRQELIQTAAVAVAWLEALERRLNDAS